MSKIRWLLAALGMVVIGLVPVLASSSSANADPGTVLQFDVMTPVTGPYVGTVNPIRMVPGGGLPWMITSGKGFLSRDVDETFVGGQKKNMHKDKAVRYEAKGWRIRKNHRAGNP